MPKQIQLSDKRYSRLLSLAEKAGYTIQRGPGSELGKFFDALMDSWEATKDWASLRRDLSKIGLVISFDGADDQTWNYTHAKRCVRGFDTIEDAIIAALQEKLRGG